MIALSFCLDFLIKINKLHLVLISNGQLIIEITATIIVINLLLEGIFSILHKVNVIHFNY